MWKRENLSCNFLPPAGTGSIGKEMEDEVIYCTTLRNMKNVIVLLAMLFAALSSCQRSQFSTTTRQIRNGKAVYVNHYQPARAQPVKVGVPKNRLKETHPSISKSAKPGNERQPERNPEITGISPAPIQEYENLIASVSDEPIIAAIRRDQAVPGNDFLIPPNDHPGVFDTYRHTDTLNKKKSKKEKARVAAGRQVVFFQNGTKKIVKIISQSNDTLFYVLNSEENIVRGVTMDQVDTIITIPFGEQQCIFKNGKKEAVSVITQFNDSLFYTLVNPPGILHGVPLVQVDTVIKMKYWDQVKGRVVDNRKNEPLSIIGFISSILGLVPLAGLPFAIAGLILGYKGLRRIRANPLRFKGTKFAKASITIGVIGLVIFLISIIAALSSSVNSCHSSGARFGP